MNSNFSPVGLFRRDITDPEQLVATTIARHHLVDDLLEKLKRRGNKKSGQNHLFIGPRGIGKTHLLSLLQYGIETDSDLNKRYSIIRFPEESNRVLSFADLLLGIIDLLAEVENDPQWRELHNKIETEDDDNIIIDYILPRLKHWHKQSGKVLLVLMENLDVLFTQQIKNKQDIHRIRRLLMDNSHIVLIGSAPTFFPALNDVKHPLYDFFDIQIIEELDQAQTLALIKTHLEWDKHDKLLQQFDQLKPRILAMHTLTGGNPRLIMMLYELIVQNNLTEIKTRFHQLLDRITPFYQDRLKDLPPQERALLETIALMRFQKRTPVNIARKFRKPRHQTSVLLKRMTEAGYLSVSTNPNDKRSRLYRIKEGFFDIWLAMNESRAQRKYLPYLVDFFTLWYASVEERENKRRQLAKKLSDLKEKKEQEKEQENALEILAYLSEATEHDDEKYQTKMELVIQQLKFGHTGQAQIILKETEKILITKPQRLMVWMYDKASHWSTGKQPENVLQQMEKIIAYWQEQRSGELENVVRLFHELSLDFSAHGLHKLHIALLQDQISNSEGAEEKVNLLLQIARSEQSDGQLSTALETLNHAFELTREIKNKKLEGTTLNNISQIFKARGDYETALEYLNQSLAIVQEIGDSAGLCSSLFNIGHIHLQNKEPQKAMQAWMNAYRIAKKINLAQVLDALENLAKNLGLDKGLKSWEKLASNDED
jgi:tetratricopeptide (TPR) repeat protein